MTLSEKHFIQFRWTENSAFLLDVLVNRGGRGLACAHGEDDGGGAGDSVSACIYPRTGGGHVLVSYETAAGRGVQTFCGAADQWVR